MEIPMQHQNNIVALRDTLFETLRALGNKENPMDIDRAKAINDVAQTIINSAKVEVDAMRMIGITGTDFIPANLPEPKKERSNISHPKPGVTVHRLLG